MKYLYLISQDENGGYDTCDSAVVVAESEEDARHIDPIRKGMAIEWCEPEFVKVTYLGIAKRSLKCGLVCASYNPG